MSDSKQILVVEDEDHLAAGIRYNLEAEGYRVLLAQDGNGALELVRAHDSEIDLIILDLMLPGMSGYELCETIRKSGHRMPVLILSARTLAEDKTRGFDAGANQYLVKPFELDELLSRVKNLLLLGPVSRPSAPPKIPGDTGNRDVFEFSGCSLNFRTFYLSANGKSVRLTALQMKLMRYLIANAERVVPRSELLEQVWEMPGHMQTRAPDQVIRQLRKLFEKDPAAPRHLLTIRDAGYLFVPEPDRQPDEIPGTG